MLLAPQPFVRAQQPLAAYWQALVAAPQVRLSRWLTTEADRPLLHDYLLGLSTGPEAPLRRLPLAADGALLPAGSASPGISWLEHPGPKAEEQLRLHLASQNAPCLLVLEDAATQPWQRLARWFPATVHTCTPAVSMRQVLADLRHATPADEATGRFQEQFHLFTEAMARADSPAVRAHSAACLAACAALPSAGAAAVTVGLAGGQYFLAQKQAEEALRHFAGALAGAEAAFAAGDAAAGLLSVQVWLGEALAWQQSRRSAAALAALQQALDRATQLPPSLLGVEAARRLGLALEQDGQRRPALATYQHGLDIAAQLPSEQRVASIITALGDAYLKCLRATPNQQLVRAQLMQLLA